MQFMECPCGQFSSLVENGLKNEMDVVQRDQKIMAMTSLHFNQEFLFLRVLYSLLTHVFLVCIYITKEMLCFQSTIN